MNYKLRDIIIEFNPQKSKFLIVSNIDYISLFTVQNVDNFPIDLLID